MFCRTAVPPCFTYLATSHPEADGHDNPEKHEHGVEDTSAAERSSLSQFFAHFNTTDIRSTPFHPLDNKKGREALPPA